MPFVVIPPGVRTCPEIPIYTTSYPVESQIAIVHHPRDFQPSSIKRCNIKPLPRMNEIESIAQAAACMNPPATEELGIQPRRYQTYNGHYVSN